MSRQNHILRYTESIRHIEEKILLPENHTDRGSIVKAILDVRVINDRWLLIGYMAADQFTAVKGGEVQLAKFLRQLRIVQSDNHTALTTSGIWGIKPGFYNLVHQFPRYLLFLVFAYGAALLHQHEYIHLSQISFQHCGSAA